MTDHQKAVCYDALKEHLALTPKITGFAIVKAMEDMEEAMGFTNTIVHPPPSARKSLTGNRDIGDKE